MKSYATEEQPVEPTAPEDTEERTLEPDAPVLTAKLDPRWALGPMHVVLAAVWGLLFMLLNYLPLRATDLWCHVLYGRWILDHQALPVQDPFFPWAEGMRVVDSAWLAQVIFAAVEQYAGPEGLSNLFAIVWFTTFVLLGRVFYLQTRNPLLTLAGVLLVIGVGWSRVATIRPEIFAALCFAALLWLVVSSDPVGGAREQPAPARRWRLWIGVPLIFVAWANLHGSYLIGLAVLGCFLAGRAIEVVWQTRDPHALLVDAEVRRWLVLFELGLAATLLNPYGFDLLLETLTFSANENLRDVLEWQPLVVLGVGGREFALSWVLLLVVLRHSRRRMPPAHVLLLAVFSLAAVFGVRMLTWYAAVYAVVLTPHLADLAARLFASAGATSETPAAESLHPAHAANDAAAASPDGAVVAAPDALPPGRSWRYSLVSGLVLWIAFALSPASYMVLGGQSPRKLDQVLDAATPITAAEYLKENPPAGPIFNPQWWGDWLVFAGPEKLRPFMTTNMHLAPRQVWEDYIAVMQTRAGWQSVLAKYRIDTLVLDKAIQQNLVGALRFEPEWKILFEDEQAMVVKIPEPKKTGAASSKPAAAESAAAEPSTPEATVSEAAASESTAPAKPNASKPNASEPNASEPNASEPNASEPNASEPNASEPNASEPAASN